MMNHSKEDENHIEISFHPDKYHRVEKFDAKAEEVHSVKKNLWISILLWSRQISVISCMIAVSLDPLFFYIAYIDRVKICLGADTRLRTAVLISRSLSDFTFIVHIIYEIRKALKFAEPKLLQGGAGGSYISVLFGQAMAISKKMSWDSVLIDICAIIPIPHILIFGVFFSPNHDFSENGLSVMYLLLLQYIPRMCRIFSSSKMLRKNSSLWLKALFYLYLYMLASHALGAFRYHSAVQVEKDCWKGRLVELNKESILPKVGTTFDCSARRALNLSNDAQYLVLVYIFSTCLNATWMEGGTLGYGSFAETIMDDITAKKRFRDKLFYFMWWGLKNLSNYGTDIDTSRYVWENCFAILVSVIGLVLFAFLIGNMQQCMQSSEEKKMATDRVEKKEQELKIWMERNGLPEKLGKDAEKLRKEIMREIRNNLKNDVDNAELENVFSLLPWNTIKDLKHTICMSMLMEVPGIQNKDIRELRLICEYLKPVTYTETTISFRMGEPLDSMLFIMEGTALIYTTCSTGSPSTIHASLSKGGCFGVEQLLSWVSPPDASFANLPVLTENVKCISQVEGFILTANDLKTVVSEYKFCF